MVASFGLADNIEFALIVELPAVGGRGVISSAHGLADDMAREGFLHRRSVQ